MTANSTQINTPLPPACGFSSTNLSVIVFPTHVHCHAKYLVRGTDLGDLFHIMFSSDVCLFVEDAFANINRLAWLVCWLKLFTVCATLSSLLVPLLGRKKKLILFLASMQLHGLTSTVGESWATPRLIVSLSKAVIFQKCPVLVSKALWALLKSFGIQLLKMK